ncbi:hypothetical protein [Frankia sp. QA3]|uniref:hypothetical protein n=1 Tax=Frankia sp. QA3 TaxID=710111 RepID=UPI0012F97D0E|nr:hypothetical protein [Frankia sp. QA3]
MDTTIVNVPLGLITLLFGLVFLADVPRTAARGFDLVGFLLAAGGLAGVLYALSTGGDRPRCSSPAPSAWWRPSR